MAIDLEDKYTDVVPADADYPQGSFKNASTPSSFDGTPFEKDWPNDWLGFLSQLLYLAGVTPSGVPDTVNASDYGDALAKLYERATVFNDSGTADTYVLASSRGSGANPKAYFDGQPFIFKAATANTGASTVTVGALATVDLVRPDGSALSAGDILAGLYYIGVYRSTSGDVELISGAEGTQVFIDTVQDLRDYTRQTHVTFSTLAGYYAAGDGGGGPMRKWVDGAAPGTYVDNGGSIIVPTGGDGSGAWLFNHVGGWDIAWFGALPDGDGAGGGTDRAARIQATYDAAKAVGVAREICVPSAGIYRVDSGLTIDVSVCRTKAGGALFDFTNLVTGQAITLEGGTIAYAGNPYLNGYSFLDGLKIQGDSKTGSVTGVYFYDSALASAAHSSLRNCAVYKFGVGVDVGDNSYLTRFINTDIFECDVCVQNTSTTNSGENLAFVNCALFNSNYALNLTNPSATVRFTNCSIDGIANVYFFTPAGSVSLLGCHVEGVIDTARVFYDDNSIPGSYTHLSVANTDFVLKTSRVNAFAQFEGAINCSITGSHINDSTGSSVALFQGGGTGLVDVNGCYIPSSGGAAFESFTGGMYVQSRVIGLGRNGTSVSNTKTTAQDLTALDTVTADGGVLFNNTKTTVISALSTPTSLGLGTVQGLLVVRDGTSGGTAVYACDSSAGAISIQNNITGFSALYSAGDLSIQVTSGTVPRSIRWMFVRTQ